MNVGVNNEGQTWLQWHVTPVTLRRLFQGKCFILKGVELRLNSKSPPPPPPPLHLWGKGGIDTKPSVVRVNQVITHI